MLKRASSLLFEKRFPHFLPYFLIRKYSMKKRIKKISPKKLTVALTFDIERDSITDDQASKIFLRKIKNFLEKNKVVSTFFIQANLIQHVIDEIKKLGKNEIGLHGFSHELWGDEKWWLKKHALGLVEKEKLLDLSLEEFNKYKLKRPTSFRAPYMIINRETIELLADFNFKIDSSLPSYEGISPIPLRFFDKITSIPVSVDPEPNISFRFILPYCTYRIFTMGSLVNFNKNKFLNFVNKIISFQIWSDCKPHLVFLAHPWEFVKNKNLDYCSPKNYELLKDVCLTLEKNYKVEYVTMKELGKKLW